MFRLLYVLLKFCTGKIMFKLEWTKETLKVLKYDKLLYNISYVKSQLFFFFVIVRRNLIHDNALLIKLRRATIHVQQTRMMR